MEDLKVLLVETNAKMPTRGSKYSAGLDLYSAESVEIPPQERKMVSTGLSVSIPSGCYGRVAPRSGLAYKYGIDVFAGVIDFDFRGSVKVILYNSDKENTFKVNVGDRIAQLILEKILIPDVVNVNGLDKTDRGTGGFGSTGV